MTIAIYGGSFNPPHIGHVNVAEKVSEYFRPEKFYIIPAGTPPHKAMAADSASDAQRLEMCRLAFSGLNAEISDMEMRREGKSYTADTLMELQKVHPGQELILVMGTDMFLSLDTWNRAEFILKTAHICVLRRDEEKAAIDEKAAEYSEKYESTVTFIAAEPVPAASSDIRKLLKLRKGRELLPESVYEYIIRNRLFGACAEWEWLRKRAYSFLKPKRIAHVAGCESEAVSLARRWGADEELAAEAAILHDITKRLSLKEQLILCEKYDIITDTLEAKSEKLLHSKTGAAVAADMFGVSAQVENAIRWHTTGKPDMTKLEKIIYLADYIEPTRDFEGVETLRALAYEDLDKALVLGFEMSLEDLKSYGVPPHKNTIDALEHYRRDA